MRDGFGAHVRDALFAPERPGNLSHRFRSQRWGRLAREFPDLAEMRVLDLGGTSSAWDVAPIRPRELVLINLEPGPDDTEGIHHIQADACALPDEVLRDKFDFVYSNSVIEHVGGPHRRKIFADVIQQLAPHHWIQTPARTFPLEPHWLFPGFQFLPLAARAFISQRWPFGHIKTLGEWSDAVGDALGVDLLSTTEMGYLFPTSILYRERVMGITKSITAFA